MAAPAQRRIQPAGQFLRVLVRLVDLEIGRGGVVEDQIDIEAEQVGGLEEHVAFDLARPRRPGSRARGRLIDRQPGRVGQPGDVGQPALGAGEFGDRVVEPVGGHGEQRRLVRRGQLGPFGASADGRADAEFLPQRAGGEHDAEFEHPLDLDVGDAGRGLVGGHAIAGIEHAVDAVHQPLEGGAIELIGAAETMHHAGLCVALRLAFQTLSARA